MNDADQLEFLEMPEAERRRPRFSWGNLALLLGIAAVAGVLGLQLGRQNATQPTSGRAPDFQLTLFDGGEIRISELRGRVVLINFWASWCPPCRDEAPDLQALHEVHGDAGLTVLGVNILESSRQKALDFIDEFALTYPNGEDIGQYIANLYRVEGPPESFLIDKQGNINRFILGALRFDDMSAKIAELLAD